MTSVSTRFIVFSLLAHVLLCAANNPSGQLLLELFGNPIKDFQNTIANLKFTISNQKDIPIINEKATFKEGEKAASKEGEDDKPKDSTTMIQVPPNTERERCYGNTVKDINGVCRQPW